MIEVLLIAAAMYWVAAPDPVTAGARTAAGTGARAAGAGARSHWASGRDQRQARRTKRRDGWWKAGGWRRAALKAEHAAVWSWGAGKTAAGVTAAAVRPVPAAVKTGWSRGRDRHRTKAGNRPAPVALDLPWWHREQPQEQAPEQVQEQPGNSSGDTPEQPTGTGPGTGDLDTEEQVPTTARGHDLPPEFKPGDRLVDGTGKAWTVVDVRPQIDADTYDLVDVNGTPGYADIPRPDRWKAITEQDDPTDPSAGTSPADTSTTTEGDPVSTNVPTVELNDLDSVRRFTEYVATLPEDSEFMQIVEQCKVIRENFRAGGFGGDMDTAGAAFEESAAALATAVTEFAEQSTQYAGLATNVAGG